MSEMPQAIFLPNFEQHDFHNFSCTSRSACPGCSTIRSPPCCPIRRLFDICCSVRAIRSSEHERGRERTLAAHTPLSVIHALMIYLPQVNVAPNGQFMFAPNNFNAPNGTMVNFFFPKYVFQCNISDTNLPVCCSLGLTHSVTQSPFSQPCTYMAANGSTPGGFDSGLTENTQFSIMIEDDTKPIWFHCKQLLHCGMGMVG